MRAKTYQHFILKTSFHRVLVLVFLITYLLPGLLSAETKGRLYHDLFSVSYPTEKEGWVCGRWGTILHTVDGGKTWKPQTSGTNYTLTSIYFVDPKNGWAVGDSGTILFTENGGQSWVKQKSPIPYFLEGVHFVNARKGWIVAERTTILYTEDGGKIWKVQFSDEDFILKSVSFCDERNGWTAGEFGYIYKTNDGGKTWKRQAGEFDFSEKTGEMVGGNFLFNVIAVNSLTAWVVGIDGYVAKTFDGGATWRKVTNGIPKTHLFGIASNGKNIIIIVGDALLLTSTDGGRTFMDARIEPPIAYGWLYRVTPRDSVSFVAVGKEGCIYQSNKDGNSWKLIENSRERTSTGRR